MRKRLLIITILAFVLFILMTNTALGRYVYNSINNHILESQSFYFNSAVLNVNGARLHATDWDGVNPYTLNISVNSKKNDLVFTDSDITYDIDVSCPSTVTCNLNKSEGTIYTANKTDSYTITVVPINNFYTGDEVSVETSVTSNYPYTKTLSATYTIEVENYGFSYRIEDNVGLKYVTLILTNNKPYYTVMTAFGTYSVGDLVSIADYNALSAIDKENCRSVQVDIDWDAEEILLDVTSNVYANRVANSQSTTSISGKNYINGFTINMKAVSTETIIFYKKDASQNYTSANLITIDSR